MSSSRVASHSWWALIATALTAASALTGLFGLIAYVLLRPAYVEYYSSFNLSPEDVGIGHLEVLTHSMGTIIDVVAALVIATIIVTFLFSKPSEPETEEPPKHVGKLYEDHLARQNPSLAGRILLGIVLTLMMLSIGLFVVALIAGHWLVAGCLAVLWTVILTPSLRKQGPRRRIAQAVVFTLFLVLNADLAASSPSFSRVQAHLVRTGIATVPSEVFGAFPVLDVNGQPATIQWLNETDAGRAGCFMYLGTTNGRSAVFDFVGRQTIWIPNSSAVINLSLRKTLPQACVVRMIASQTALGCKRATLESRTSTKENPIPSAVDTEQFANEVHDAVAAGTAARYFAYKRFAGDQNVRSDFNRFLQKMRHAITQRITSCLGDRWRLDDVEVL